MNLTYDETVDAAYLSLVDTIPDGAAISQSSPIFPPGEHGEIVLDFDQDGLLLGVEILEARSVLPASVLAEASAP